jgi:Tfp pilus assembly protein PilN
VITKLNLSSKPFRNRTLPYLIAILLLACAVAGMIISFARWREVYSRHEIIKSDIQEMEKNLKDLEDQGARVQQSLSPGQKEILIAGHKLIANKTFGWSRLFADLEAVLPAGVSASRINVENVYKDGDQIKAHLDFSVLSQNYQNVMNMIQRMNQTGIFRAELRGQDLQKDDRFTYSEFTLKLTYTPRYGYSTSPGINAAVSPPEGGTKQ